MSEYCVNSYWVEGYAVGDKLMLAAAPAISTSVASEVTRIKVVAATPAIAASASAAAQRVLEAQVGKALTMTVTPSIQRVLHPVIDQIGITSTLTADVIRVCFISVVWVGCIKCYRRRCLHFAMCCNLGRHRL